MKSCCDIEHLICPIFAEKPKWKGHWQCTVIWQSGWLPSRTVTNAFSSRLVWYKRLSKEFGPSLGVRIPIFKSNMIQREKNAFGIVNVPKDWIWELIYTNLYWNKSGIVVAILSNFKCPEKQRILKTLFGKLTFGNSESFLIPVVGSNSNTDIQSKSWKSCHPISLNKHIELRFIPKMNDLTSLFSDSNSDYGTTRNLEVMNSIVTKALNENSCEAISLLSSFLLSIKAQPILQTFGQNARTLLIVHNLFTEFELTATTDLNRSFWTNHNITN